MTDSPFGSIQMLKKKKLDCAKHNKQFKNHKKGLEILRIFWFFFFFLFSLSNPGRWSLSLDGDESRKWNPEACNDRDL